MIRGGQVESIQQRLVCGDRLRRLQAFAIAPAENIRRNHQLIPAHRRLPRHLIRIHVDHLHYPIRIRPARRRHQIRHRLPADFHRRRQHLRRKHQNIRPSRSLPLIIHEPLRPRHPIPIAHRLARPRPKRHRLRRIRNIFLKRSFAIFGRRKPQLQSRAQKHRSGFRRATARAARRPRIQPPPGVRPCLVRGNRSDIRLRRAILQVPCQKRRQNLSPKIKSRVAAEFQRPQSAGVPDLLSVMPRPHHQKHFVIPAVLRLQRLVQRRRPVNILLVPQAVYEHHRHFQRLRGKNLVHRLFLPKGVVARMLQNLAPEAHLLQPVPPPEFAG